MTAPLRVGVLNDLSDQSPGPAGVEQWLRLAVEEVRATGRIDREVRFVCASGLGLPSGTAAAVEHAYAVLEKQDVLLIVGPAIADNALVATPLAESHRLPTLNWAGAERARGEYMFHLQVGSHEDESIVLARHLAGRGMLCLGVIYDDSQIGRRHLQFLQQEAQILGLQLAPHGVSPLAGEASAEVASALASGAEALVYLGLGISAPAVARAARESGWRGPCAMNTAGLRGYAAEFAQLVDGWIYVDMRADDNRTLAELRRRQDIPAARATAAAKGYDLGRLVAEGLARAPERTREGMKAGLEQVKWLSAAEGHEGTLLGFGRFDRGALHGRYLVMRQWLEGRSVEVK
jgi:ABC-type branched-subunit amino acid transport system substrate-binding protein